MPPSRVSRPKNFVDDVSALIRSIINASIIVYGFTCTLEHRWTNYDTKILHDKVAVDFMETNEHDLQAEWVDEKWTDVK